MWNLPSIKNLKISDLEAAIKAARKSESAIGELAVALEKVRDGFKGK